MMNLICDENAANSLELSISYEKIALFEKTDEAEYQVAQHNSYFFENPFTTNNDNVEIMSSDLFQEWLQPSPEILRVVNMTFN